ncbi:hypothetical protein [Sphingomonas sp. PAMC 26605]|uniref:hypothetical protein n=1 Tax=Sphingomonas sp. PAMC 26605 TaxID=1112214 RepID=UPI0005671F42|nr:hypothetical protein [Sphingomonas sp. PAMC 26605]
MTRSMKIAGCAVAALLPTAALAQTMPGMTMDMPMRAEPKPQSTQRATPADTHRTVPGPLPAATPAASPARAKDRSTAPDHRALPAQTNGSMPGPRGSSGKREAEDDSGPMSGMAMPQASPSLSAPIGDTDHTGPAMPGMPGMPMRGMVMGPPDSAYAEGSGTARNPGNDGAMHGVHVMHGDWMLMLHGYAWGVYTDQGGPRGDREAFVESMAMLSAARDFGGARLQLRSMLSLEPAMGAKGYPNLFATGETADGRTQLVDRQHPHDLFMELSARVDVDAESGSVFVYGGPVAEPALGPSAFMHRGSATYQPLAPITHHWFDSTHISYGVVTVGYAARRWQLEASAFRGREPDQYRWGIERPSLDSWSVRATWTPSPAWSVQASHGWLKSPEQLEPDRNEARTTASVQYARHGVSALLAWSAKHPLPGRVLTAWLAEANWDIDQHHTLFARAEDVANDELFPDHRDPLHDRKFRVGKLEAGYAYRLPFVGPFDLALGGALGVYATPAALDAAYGAFPVSFSLFAKVSLGG